MPHGTLLSTRIHQAICVLGECIHPQFSEPALKTPVFHGLQAQPLYTAILLGACAHHWPELQSQLYELGDNPEKPVSLQAILDIIVVFESVQARYMQLPEEQDDQSGCASSPLFTFGESLSTRVN